MIERLGLTTIAELEAALARPRHGRRDAADAGPGVGRRRRLRASERLPTPSGAIDRAASAVIRSVRRSLLLAAALALLVVGAALGVRFGLELLEIDFGPVPSAGASAASKRPGQRPGWATRVDARARPPASTLDAGHGGRRLPAPASGRRSGHPTRSTVAATRCAGRSPSSIAPRADLPAADLLGGAACWSPRTVATSTRAWSTSSSTWSSAGRPGRGRRRRPGSGSPAQPHVFWYFAIDGTIIQESERRVGDTLAWERRDPLSDRGRRREGACPRDRRSMRAP